MELAEVWSPEWYSNVVEDEMLLPCMEANMSDYNRDFSVGSGVNRFSRAAGWLADNVRHPVAAYLSSLSARATHRAVVYYRRASTRAAGLVLNTLDGFVE